MYLHYGEGNRDPLSYSCLENPLDRGAWRAMAQSHEGPGRAARLCTCAPVLCCCLFLCVTRGLFTFLFFCLLSLNFLFWDYCRVQSPCGDNTCSSHSSESVTMSHLRINMWPEPQVDFAMSTVPGPYLELPFLSFSPQVTVPPCGLVSGDPASWPVLIREWRIALILGLFSSSWG